MEERKQSICLPRGEWTMTSWYTECESGVNLNEIKTRDF